MTEAHPHRAVEERRILSERWAGLDVFTVGQFAEIFGLSHGPAYQAIRAGRVRSIRFGRKIFIPRLAIEQLLQEGAQP